MVTRFRERMWTTRDMKKMADPDFEAAKFLTNPRLPTASTAALGIQGHGRSTAECGRSKVSSARREDRHERYNMCNKFLTKLRICCYFRETGQKIEKDSTQQRPFA